MTIDLDVTQSEQRHILSVCVLAGKHPVSGAIGQEVFLLDPLAAFIRVSALRPLPQQLPEDMVHGRVGFLGDRVLVVISPAPDDRVQEFYEILLLGHLVRLDDTRHLFPECPHVVLCRLMQVFSLLPVLPHVPAEKVESVADVRDFGLFRREH